MCVHVSNIKCVSVMGRTLAIPIYKALLCFLLILLIECYIPQMYVPVTGSSVPPSTFLKPSSSEALMYMQFCECVSVCVCLCVCVCRCKQHSD